MMVVKTLFGGSMFAVFHTISTLSQELGEVKEIESPQDGYHANGGFLVIVAGKHGPL